MVKRSSSRNFIKLFIINQLPDGLNAALNSKTFLINFKLIKFPQISYAIIYATLIKILLHFLLFHYSNFAPAHCGKN